MKSVRLLSIALIASVTMLFHSAAFAIGPTYSGSWYNPDQSGHGFSVEYSVLDDESSVVVAYWYVYDSEGNPIYLIGVGEPQEDNSVTLVFEAPYGMKFGEFDPDSTIRGDGGSGVFTFEDSESGVFTYQPSQWMIDTYGVSAISIPVVKLLEVAHPNVDPPPTGEPVSLPGSWSGRMTYDRASPAGNACYDADVQVVVILASNGAHYMESITVRPDSGGLYLGDLRSYVSDTWHTNGNVYSLNIDYNIAFNTQGNAQGLWVYDNSDCYGEWTFTKD
jgi:hypothetical protein